MTHGSVVSILVFLSPTDFNLFALRDGQFDQSESAIG